MKLNSKGFTLIEGLLIVIALAMVGGVGFYVYDANKDNKKAEPVTQSQQSESKPLEKKKEYLEVKELGVKIPSESIKSISYKLSDGATPDAKVYNFSDGEITKRVNSCRLSGEKFDGYRVYELFRGDGKFNPNREAASTAQLLKQFDNFYVAFIGQPNFSPCTDASGISVDNEGITSDIEKAQKNLSTAFESAEEIKQ